MSRIIGILNYKGGTGKTTTVVNLASGLAALGARVLCVDLDAQGSLATYLGVRFTHSITHLLLGQADPETCIVRARENLDIIGSDRSLLQAERMMYRIDDDCRARQALAHKMRGINRYDFIILDFSPSGSILSEAGLLYAREVIVPVSMDYLALVGVREVIQTLKNLARTPGYGVRFFLILPMFYYARLRKDRQILETLHRYFDGKVADPIRASVKLSEAPSHQVSIYEYAPGSASAIDYAYLVERVANGG